MNYEDYDNDDNLEDNDDNIDDNDNDHWTRPLYHEATSAEAKGSASCAIQDSPTWSRLW